jgi:signal transduction histidine kinase/DNA-binding response OmpR family regulator
VLFASQAAIANARRHRDELRARADLETLIDTSPVGVAVFDARIGLPKSFNREARRIVDSLRDPDQTPEQLLEIVTCIRADGREVSLGEFPMAELLSTGETVRAEEIVMRVPDGRSVTVLLNATPILSGQGAVESVVVTMQDMAEVEELERLRAEFLGMVSHELRTPLATIKGSTTALLSGSPDLDPAVMTQFHRIMDQQVDHMQDLIGDLLDVARIETGTLSVKPAPADVAGMVDDARRRFLGGGGRDNLLVDLAPDLPPVLADQRRIVQVLTNLLSNAAGYSPQGSPIRVSAVRDGVHVAVSVSDEGRGLPAEQLPHLFRKFSRIDGGNAGSSVAGSGLGLAICKGIVEAHGGRIRAESDGLGLGSRFTFTVPAVREAARRASARPRRRPRKEPERTRILCVDDDPQTLRYVRDALTRSGYAPVVTGDPEDVPRLMAEEPPRLVLLDLVLPGSDGIELMEQVREIADVPVIFLSAYGQDEVVARAFGLGAADYVVKPFSPTELAARIRAALRKRGAPELAEPSRPYVRGDLTVDYALRLVTLAGNPVALTATEYRMLVELSANAGLPLTHQHLLHRVWGPDKGGDSGPVRNIVRRLRRKLGDDPDDPTYIFALPTVGYRMAEAETPEQVGA